MKSCFVSLIFWVLCDYVKINIFQDILLVVIYFILFYFLVCFVIEGNFPSIQSLWMRLILFHHYTIWQHSISIKTQMDSTILCKIYWKSWWSVCNVRFKGWKMLCKAWCSPYLFHLLLNSLLQHHVTMTCHYFMFHGMCWLLCNSVCDVLDKLIVMAMQNVHESLIYHQFHIY